MGKIMVKITILPSAKATGSLVKVLIICRTCDVDRIWDSKTGKMLQVPSRTLKTAKFKCYKCGSPNVKVILGKALQERGQKYWGTPPSKRYFGGRDDLRKTKNKQKANQELRDYLKNS